MTGYLYILKHGIGPGTMPNDVTILKEKDLPNYYTAVWLDRFLTTSELKQYDIPSETRINELLSRIDYCQADNGDDVVPCDEVLASSYIKSAREPKWWGSTYSCQVVDAYNKGELTYKNMEEWETEYNGGFKPSNMGTKGILDYYIKTGKDPRDDVEACGDIKASKKIVASKMSDIDLLMKEALDCTTKDELGSVISGLDSLGLRKLYLHYMEMLRDDSLSVGYIASDLSDTLYNMFHSVDACDKVTASSNTEMDLPTFKEFATTEWEFLNDGSKRLKLKDLFVYFGTDKQWNASDPGYWYEIKIGDKTYKESKKYSINNKERCYKAMQRAVAKLLQSDSIESCDTVYASDTKYFANMVSASEFDSFDDEYGVHRVSKSDLNYIRNSIYERISDATDIKFSIDMTITKQLPDAIAKVHITLRNLDDGTILEYDDRVDSNNLEGTIQRLTKFAKALVTENWSEFPDNITDEDVERISGDIYDEIETTIFDYYLYGTPEFMTLYDEEDPTFLYNIDTDYSDLPDSLTFNIKLEALDQDDLKGLVEDYLKPITKDYDPKYTIEHSKTGRTGKTGYIHIKFQ